MNFLRKHLEWTVFAAGLLLLALMDPNTAGTDLCFFEWIGVDFCPGDGLGHSIAYTFRGNMESAFQANFMGPFAVLILSFRILQIWKNLIYNTTTDKTEKNNG